MDADALALLSWQFFFPLKVLACFASSIIPLSFFFFWGGVRSLLCLISADCTFAFGASIRLQRGHFITTEGDENNDLTINFFQTLLLLIPAPVCRDSSAAPRPCMSQSMLPFHLVSSERQLVKDLTQSPPKPINFHFQPAVTRTDRWMETSPQVGLLRNNS